MKQPPGGAGVCSAGARLRVGLGREARRPVGAPLLVQIDRQARADPIERGANRAHAIASSRGPRIGPRQVRRDDIDVNAVGAAAAFVLQIAQTVGVERPRSGDEVIFRARDRDDPLRIERFHTIAQESGRGMRDRAVGVIVLVAEIEHRVPEGTHCLGDRLHRFCPRCFRLEQRERLTAELSWSEDDELEGQRAVLQPAREREQPRAPIGTQGSVRLVDRGVPVRPYAHRVHAPAGERVQIAIARCRRAERVEQADTGQKRVAAIDQEALLRDAERARGSRGVERDREQPREGGRDQGCDVVTRAGMSVRGSPSICPGTR